MSELVCPSDYQLDTYWLAGRPDDHPVARHLGTCETCRERLAEMEAVSETFGREVFPVTEDEVIRAADRRPLFRMPLMAAAAAAAVLLLVLGVVYLGPEEQPGRDPRVTVKGAVGVQVFCRRGESTFRVYEGDTLLPGDALRFVVAPPEDGFVTIVSEGAGGEVSVYHPAREVRGVETELPGSVILDDSRGPERIIVLFSKQRLDPREARETAAARTSLLFVKGE